MDLRETKSEKTKKVKYFVKYLRMWIFFGNFARLF